MNDELIAMEIRDVASIAISAVERMEALLVLERHPLDTLIASRGTRLAKEDRELTGD
ncbi:hypothetical protein [uncultured Stenotrophomonas sp.]|uniref:hypothetical protein n=1 Tax=uncultured Stenotrophomonas sp. TaxID=165438 RepID=UPI0025D0AD6F|nr:hypothetical protein [uncultured Stenotrophomonas sp.]